MAIRVTVTDLETGDSDEAVVQDGDYLIVTTEPCHVDGPQVYRSGRTHVVTIKDRLLGQPAQQQQQEGGE